MTKKEKKIEKDFKSTNKKRPYVSSDSGSSIPKSSDGEVTPPQQGASPVLASISKRESSSPDLPLSSHMKPYPAKEGKIGKRAPSNEETSPGEANIHLYRTQTHAQTKQDLKSKGIAPSEHYGGYTEDRGYVEKPQNKYINKAAKLDPDSAVDVVRATVKKANLEGLHQKAESGTMSFGTGDKAYKGQETRQAIVAGLEGFKSVRIERKGKVSKEDKIEAEKQRRNQVRRRRLS